MSRINCSLALLLCIPTIGWSQEELQVETVIDGLHHPLGVAIQPVTGNILIAEGGAGRVVRIESGKAVPVASGFPTGPLDWNENVLAGPMGISFFSKDLLVVGWGGNTDGPQQLQMFELTEPLQELNAGEHPNGQTLSGEDASVSLGGFYGVVSSPRGVYFSTRGEDAKGWIGRSMVAENRLAEASRFIATTPEAGVGNPTGLTISPDGFVVVSQMGAVGEDADSQLSFYDEPTGELKANFATGLQDMVAIAYGPKAGRLFAVDASWNDASKCGLFKLIGRENFTKCIHEKILDLDHPTAMAFDKDGNLYVTVLGNDLAADSASGKLIKISGLDVKKDAEEAQETEQKGGG